VRGGLTRRLIVASGLLAVVIGAAFGILLSSIAQLRASEARAKHAEQVLVVANGLERQIVAVEAGLRGDLIVDSQGDLERWREAQDAFPEQARTLERLVADHPDQAVRVRGIAQAGASYIRDYSVPLIAAARRDPASARTRAATVEGNRRMDQILGRFDSFLTAENDFASARQSQSNAIARRAIVAATGGLLGSIGLIVLFTGYLARAIVRPVRRTATMAGRLAGGDLGVRMAVRGVDELGVLERSFNTMAGSLEANRAELAASRARIVTAADEARRLIERDLHDGTQQRLVSLMLDLRATEAALPPERPEISAQLSRVAKGLAGALDDLREISRGIHPAILSEGGLWPALKALGRRSVVPVELDLDVQARLPDPIEVAVYYVVSEALANAAKHSRASVVHVAGRARDGIVHLSVRDDGIGGAVPGKGSGLIGLADRVEALGGTISVTSPAGHGTELLVTLPITDAHSG
jgi:signal transduction histidine kinase